MGPAPQRVALVDNVKGGKVYNACYWIAVHVDDVELADNGPTGNTGCPMMHDQLPAVKESSVT